MSDAVTHNLGQLNSALGRYIVVIGKTPREVLLKKGGSLAYALAKRLRALAPAPGSIREGRIAAMEDGVGLRVRATARKYADRHTVATALNFQTLKSSSYREIGRTGKLKNKGKGWWELAVKRELGVRESGRGFLAQSARYPRTLKQNRTFANSRFGAILSAAGFDAAANNESLTFSWDPARNELQASAGKGLNKAKGRAAIALAIRDEIADIDKYFAGQLDKARQQARL